MFARLAKLIPASACVIALPWLLLFAGCKEKPRQEAQRGNTNLGIIAREETSAIAAPSATVDWSKSNAVSIVLGDESNYGGLKHNDKERDGITSIVKVADVPCRLLNHKERGRAEAFLYFSIDPAFKATGATNVKVDVEYFDVLLDETRTTFGIHYDAAGAGGSLSSRYRSAGRTVMLTGVNKWLTTTFYLRNAAFKNAQNGQSDFRIYVRPPDLYVRRVTVTRLDGQPAR
jgi:hypothetical protein